MTNRHDPLRPPTDATTNEPMANPMKNQNQDLNYHWLTDTGVAMIDNPPPMKTRAWHSIRIFSASTCNNSVDITELNISYQKKKTASLESSNTLHFNYKAMDE